MFEKIVIIGDMHIGIKSFSKTFFEQQMSYFENVVFPYIIDNNVKTVLQLGDIVHNRNIMDNFIDQSFKKRFLGWFEKNLINLYVLIGNHDIYFKNRIEYNYQSSNFGEYQYVHAMDKFCKKLIHNYVFGFVPWICSSGDLSIIPKPEEVDVLLGHLEIQGALMHGNYHSKVGLNSNLFDDYKVVLSGHYHSKSQYNNIMYVGTPYQLDWGEYDTPKGFHVLNDNLNIQFIENNYSPKHLKLYYFEQDDGKIILKLGGLGKIKNVTLEESQEYAKTNYMKFIIKKFNNHELLSKYFEKISLYSFDRIDTVNESNIIEDFDIDNFHKEVKEDVEFNTILESFLDNTSFEQDVNKVKLLDFINELYHEACKE